MHANISMLEENNFGFYVNLPGQGGTMHRVPTSTRNAGFFTKSSFTMIFSTGQLSTHVPLLLRLLHACIL